MFDSLVIFLFTFVMLLVCSNLVYTETYIQNGHIRFMKKREGKWEIFKTKLGFKPTYEGCFVYKLSYTDKVCCVHFKASKTLYNSLRDACDEGRKVRLYYDKRMLQKSSVVNFEL